MDEINPPIIKTAKKIIGPNDPEQRVFNQMQKTNESLQKLGAGKPYKGNRHG
jgi:hypothetical protein